MKEGGDNKRNPALKGIELLADASAAMLYSTEELGAIMADGEVHEFEELRNNALDDRGNKFCIGYGEQLDDISQMAAEEDTEYK